MEEEIDVLKLFRKSDQEMIHDIIDMKLLDIDIPIYIRKEIEDDESDGIQGKGSY